MYYSHFGLNQPPFRITPDTDFFFSGGNRGAILEALLYAILNGEGVVKVTGEVGSGKTMLCSMLQTRLPPHIETVYLAHPNVQPDEILHAIAFDLQVGVTRGAPRIEVTHRLHDYLLARHAAGKRVVIFIEEAQAMPLATLEEIRLLSNLETRQDKLLQIVLFGQPELDQNLQQPNIRQLRERITQSFRLEPLNAAETHHYLMFRMRAAGYHGPDLFSSAVVRAIARASRGLTRRINVLADKTLLAAFSENTHTIRLSHVKAALRDSEFGMPSWRGRGLAGGAAWMAAGIAIGVSAYALIPRESGMDAGGAAGMAPPPAPAEARSISPGTSVKETAAGSKDALPVNQNAGVADKTPDPSAAHTKTANLIAQRLAATEQWLSGAAHTTYSIQLLGSEDEEQLRRYLNDIAKFVEVNKVFLYRTVANRKASLTVLYGSFADREAAQDALENLPPALKAYRPILRTVRGIRTEIRRLQSS